MAVVIFTLLSMVWGTTWLAIKISLEGLPPFLGATARFMVAISLLAAYALLKKISLKVPRKDFLKIFITSFLMYTFDYGLVYWGEQYLSAGVTAIFFATFPIFVGIFSNFIIRNEPFLWSKFLGIFLGFMGVLLIFFDQLIKTRFETMIIFATLAIILGAAGGALSTVLVKKYFLHYRAVPLTLHQMLWGILVLALIGLLQGETRQIQPTPRVMVAVLYLGAVGSAFAFVGYYWLLQHISAITLSLIIYITPVIALIIDWILYGEAINLRMVIGIALIFGGIALSQLEDYRPFFRKRFMAYHPVSGSKK